MSWTWETHYLKNNKQVLFHPLKREGEKKSRNSYGLAWIYWWAAPCPKPRLIQPSFGFSSFFCCLSCRSIPVRNGRKWRDFGLNDSSLTTSQPKPPSETPAMGFHWEAPKDWNLHSSINVSKGRSGGADSEIVFYTTKYNGWHSIKFTRSISHKEMCLDHQFSTLTTDKEIQEKLLAKELQKF